MLYVLLKTWRNLIKNPKAFGYCQINNENRITKNSRKQTSNNPEMIH